MAGSLGLQGAYASGSLQALLRQRMQDQIDAELRARQAMESDRRFGLDQQAHASTEQLKRATLDATIANRDAQRGDQQFRMDQGLAEQIPANAELPGTSPVLGQLQRIGMVAAKGIQEQPPPASIAANPDETPTDLPGTVANSPMPSGRLYRKLPTSKQQEFASTAQDKAAQAAETVRLREEALARAREQDASTAQRHAADLSERTQYHAGVLSKQTAKEDARSWVIRDGKVVRVAEGDIRPGDQPYQAPRSLGDTAQDRQRQGRLQSAQEFLGRLDELRTKINTKVGPAAGITGLMRRGQAAIGYDPDVAEYERVRSAGGRALAVAIMGAQNLSDADAKAWSDMLPGATVDAITAKRLTDQVKRMLDDTQAASRPASGSVPSAATPAPATPSPVVKWGKDATGKPVRLP